MRDLNAKVAVVTGASMGIGEAVAKSLAEAGCHVALLARGREQLERVAGEIAAKGGRAASYTCDMSSPAAIYATLDRIAVDLGPIDILINNVGAGTFKPLELMTREEVAVALATPFQAAMIACHAVVPGMKARRSGHIVNLTSPAGYFPLPNMVPYTACRFAMRGLSLALREELEPFGVGVSLVCPPKVDTGYFERNNADFSWYPRISSMFPTLSAPGGRRRGATRHRREPWGTGFSAEACRCGSDVPAHAEHQLCTDEGLGIVSPGQGIRRRERWKLLMYGVALRESWCRHVPEDRTLTVERSPFCIFEARGNLPANHSAGLESGQHPDDTDSRGGKILTIYRGRKRHHV